MKGAKEYAQLFETGQYGKLFITTGSYARGTTFKIFIVPKGEDFERKDGIFLNPNVRMVYGVLGGQPGWIEYYGWIHKGPWVDDFNALVKATKELKAEKEEKARLEKAKKEKEAQRKTKLILNSY